MARTNFDDMPTLSASPPTSPRRTRRSWARRVERCCCQTVSYFPLSFVYGLTTWAVWVEVSVAFLGLQPGETNTAWYAYLKAALGVGLWGLLNSSYTIAVFTNPGSPLDERVDLGRRRGGGNSKRGGYEGLPTYEDDETDGPQELPHDMTTVTAKSSGKPRYCKKCRSVKPDRAHHCSTCGRCVLKMDHHCPWLATCVGLRNYKPFLLFLTYTSLFCWLCFGVSASWVWVEIIDETAQLQEGLKVVNTILLAVLGGIIGLVLSGFTGWHIYLAVTGQTTIESLEKTRYLSPLRKSMEHQLQSQRNYLGQEEQQRDPEDQPLTDRLKEIHANALPGVLRPEEGEESSRSHTPNPSFHHESSSSPAKDSLHRSYASMEAQRERERYDAYLDEQDSEKLPNAFHLGWKRNLLHVFGSNPLLWPLPVCNTSGDGWMWDVSPKWTAAREEVARNREQRQREQAVWDGDRQSQRSFEPPRRDWRWTPGQGFVNQARNTPPPPRVSHGQPMLDGHVRSGSSTDLQLQPLDRRKQSGDADGYDTSSSDEEVKRMYNHVGIQGHGNGTMANWNDVPDDFLTPKRNGSGRSSSRGRKKGD